MWDQGKLGRFSNFDAAMITLIFRFCSGLGAIVISSYFLPVSSQSNVTTVVSGCDGTPITLPKSPLAPADPTLQYIFSIFRHGIRSSVLDKHNPGQLTEYGKLQMNEVGRRLRERYGGFLGYYDQTEIKVTSSGSPRSSESAVAVMAGLFPNVSQPITPITDHVMDKNYLMDNHELASKLCPRLGQAIQNGIKANFRLDVRPKYKLLYQYLKKNIEYPGLEASIAHASGAFDLLHFACLNGNRLPEWATKPQPELGNKPLYPDALLPLWLDYNKNSGWLSQDRSKLITGPFFETIIEAMIKKPGRFRFHCSHDNILFPIMWTFQIENGSNVEPGDGLVFELHHIDGKEVTRIFRYKALNGHSMTEVVSPLCPPPCSFTYYSYLGLSPEEWSHECRSSRPP